MLDEPLDFDPFAYEIDNNPNLIRLECIECGEIIVSSIDNKYMDCPECDGEGTLIPIRDHENN